MPPNPFADEAKYRSMVEELRRKPPPTNPPVLSAEEDIANAVADIRKGNFTAMIEPDRLLTSLIDRVRNPETVIVNATPLYLATANKNEEIQIYEIPNLAPPWDHSLICYQNHHGNILVMETTAKEITKMPWERNVVDAGLPIAKGYEAAPDGDYEVDESRIRWAVESTIWLGGQGGDGSRRGTRGPLHIWRAVIYDDGSPADIGWVHLQPDYPVEFWDTAMLVWLNTYNFMQCNNIELVEPHRTRPQRRRLERQGVVIKELNVFPVSRRTSSTPGNTDGAGTPLTSVRGHFAHYGEKYDRKKLFGKIEGRFWVPQYARGSEDNGKNINIYKPKP